MSVVTDAEDVLCSLAYLSVRLSTQRSSVALFVLTDVSTVCSKRWQEEERWKRWERKTK